jgi:NADPH2:quinone reductase
MRAIRVHAFGGPEELRLDEIPDPRSPAAGEVLVRLRAAGVNPVETYVRGGQYARLPELPYTPGSDGAGVVEAVGDPASALRPGERVYTSGSLTGTYAEAALCPVDHVHALPDGVGFSEGAALGVPYATAHHALFRRGGLRAGEPVLVRGASGGVGLAAVQLAVAAGAEVDGTAGSDAGRRLAAAQGARLVVDHRAPGHVDELRAARGGRGYALIVEMAAHATLPADLGLLAARGRVVVVGSRGAVEIDPRDLMSRDADLRGLLLWNVPAGELAEIHAALYEGLAAGRLRPVVARELPLGEAGEAHRAVVVGPAAGKIVLVP